MDGTTPSTKTIYSFGTKQAIYVDTDCRADFVSLEQPQIALVNLEEQKFYTSVYLSLSSVVKLLRYMTDRFHLYPVKETAVWYIFIIWILLELYDLISICRFLFARSSKYHGNINIRSINSSKTSIVTRNNEKQKGKLSGYKYISFHVTSPENEYPVQSQLLSLFFSHLYPFW